MFLCNMNFYLFLLFSFIMNLIGGFMLSDDWSIYLEFYLLNLNSLSVSYIIFMDWVSSIFMGFVLFISALIFKYISGYMGDDKNLKRFNLLVVLFIISMMFMIMSLNLIVILLGWDLLGLVSYILVIYYQNVKSYNAGMLTALSNRVGDAALLMSIALSSNLGSWNFMFYKDFCGEDETGLIYMYMLLAAMTKSAQIPFSSWLPAAMAAPTPVSSLVHSSTLVTAGVYLLIRVASNFIESLLMFLLFFSLLTMFMAGACANFEYDLKKIIALSTLSQLGMMITILCVGGAELAFFHLLIHALFKALLFMCAGVIIHSLGNNQDIRYMGSMLKCMPLTCVCLNISNLALCGLPFMSGFYSKDLIIEMFTLNMNNIFVYILFYLSIGLTVSYSVRLSYYIFMGSNNFINLMSFSDDNNKIMLKMMGFMVIFVVFMGSCLSWLMFMTPYFILLPLYMKMLTLIIIIIGSFLGYNLMKMYYYFTLKSMMIKNFSMFMGQMWNLPFLSTYGVNSKFLFLGKHYFIKYDQGWFEYYGSVNLFKILVVNSKAFQLFSRNHLKLFLMSFLIVSMIFIFL
uniref:NADH dehydrogenase subunit 5 n=1 Tax=Hylurgus ligniperda TaxID=167147 RepID=UPI0027AB6AD4|nr:NADH dehydrogenase subunit 5 [Hylurgus ligniperda]WGL40351.1 NADH dehydrogenase subunit 5 [Hylurgus ligniperda]WKD83316.1 NADH dehydrogenase subunit 5 [Hylurgus ligniperda]